ncbi:NIPA-like protein 2 isoform X3 [Columba livia]|uniref:NIPA-like protein 2 isoform X3 n=1 Tax=Columba livia TaxID=8932 RepID=UPI0031BB93CD
MASDQGVKPGTWTSSLIQSGHSGIRPLGVRALGAGPSLAPGTEHTRRNTGSNRDILVGDIRSKYTPRTHSKTSTELLSELAFFGIFGLTTGLPSLALHHCCSRGFPRRQKQPSTQILEIIIFCILLYFYKRKAVKHIVVLLMMVALLASLTVIAVKAVASMITLSAKGKMQLTYPVFYIMIVLMATSCAFQVKFLSQAMHLYEVTAVVPINFVFFTISAIISGVIFYREFQSAALLSVFMFLFGCLLSFLGVFVIERSKKEEHLHSPFIDCGHIPGQKLTGKVQPDYHSSRYGTLNNEDNSVKSQS